MSNVVTMIDTLDLAKAAKTAGITLEQARVFAAALGGLPANTVLRICLGALETHRARDARASRRGQ